MSSQKIFRLNLGMYLSEVSNGVVEEGRPKCIPQPGQGLNLGTHWLAVRDLTNCAKFEISL